MALSRVVAREERCVALALPVLNCKTAFQWKVRGDEFARRHGPTKALAQPVAPLRQLSSRRGKHHRRNFESPSSRGVAKAFGTATFSLESTLRSNVTTNMPSVVLSLGERSAAQNTLHRCATRMEMEDRRRCHHGGA